MLSSQPERQQRYTEVKLYFDKQSGLLVKSQFKGYSSEQKKEVLADYFYQKHQLVALRKKRRASVATDNCQPFPKQ